MWSTGYSCQVLTKPEFCRKIVEKTETEIQNFMKILPLGADLFHADGRTEKQDMTKLSRFSQFCGKRPKRADGHRLGMEGKCKLYVVTPVLSCSDSKCRMALIHGNHDDGKGIKAVFRGKLLKYLFV